MDPLRWFDRAMPVHQVKTRATSRPVFTNRGRASSTLPRHSERLERGAVQLFQLVAELDGARVVHEEQHLRHVHGQEREIPREEVGCAHDHPRPHRHEEKTWNKQQQ